MSVNVNTIADMLDIAVNEVPTKPSEPATLHSWDEAYVAFWEIAFEACEDLIVGFEAQSLLAGYLSGAVDDAMSYVSSVVGFRRYREAG